MTAHFDHLLLN